MKSRAYSSVRQGALINAHKTRLLTPLDYSSGTMLKRQYEIVEVCACTCAHTHTRVLVDVQTYIALLNAYTQSYVRACAYTNMYEIQHVCMRTLQNACRLVHTSTYLALPLTRLAVVVDPCPFGMARLR